MLENFTRQVTSEGLWKTRENLTDGGRIAYDLFQVKNKSDRRIDAYLKHVLNGIYIMPDLESALRLKRRLGRNFKKIITLQGEVISGWSIQSYGNERDLPMYVRRLQEFSVVRERDVLERRVLELEEKIKQEDGPGHGEEIAQVESQLEKRRWEGRKVVGMVEKARANMKLVEKEMDLLGNKIQYNQKQIQEADLELGINTETYKFGDQ